VAYPNDPGYKGDDFRSIFYPLTRELREHIEETVLIQYRNSFDARSKVPKEAPKKRGRPAKKK
jgi:stage V sporulation protein G